MSGGVDSSVTAALLKEQGYGVHGFFMALAQPDLEQQIIRVRQVAVRLEVELEVVDFAEPFQRLILDYFVTGYRQGRTPNPCVICNRAVKTGLLLDLSRARGCDFLATGHYARIEAGEEGRFHLRQGADPRKDQSYFLCRLDQARLAGLRTPLGRYTKDEVYRMAAARGLTGVHGKESQDVCFLQNETLEAFFARHSRDDLPAGLITLADGTVKGRHQGIHRFTVGQRRGLGIPDATPYYVVGLDCDHNRVVVGKKEDLFQQTMTLRQPHWLAGEPPVLPGRFLAKIRFRHQPAPATVRPDERGADRLRVEFDQPQRAVTPGQFAVFYRDDEVMGSGEICEE